MCIIIAKKQGFKLPSYQILQNCWNNNSDGAGFAYNHNNKVIIEKGFMRFENLYARLNEINRTLGLTDRSIIIHFRRSTSGRIDSGNCHPFPISYRKEDLRATHFTTNLAMAHNGIITRYNRIDKILNDTQIYIQRIVKPLYRCHSEFYHDRKMIDILEETSKSKLAFLDTNGDIQLIGHFVADRGIIYSNETYKGKYSNTDLFEEDDFDKLMKKIVLLEEDEIVYSRDGLEIYVGGDNEIYGYDTDNRLYVLDMVNESASLIDYITDDYY